jgi:hypothetical protein
MLAPLSLRASRLFTAPCHRRGAVITAIAAVTLPLLAACGGASAPPPTPVVIVVTATPPPATSTPAVRNTPQAAVSAGGSPTARAAASPAARATATPTPAPAEQQLAVNRSNWYRGLEVTVEEVRTGGTFGSERSRQLPRGKALVGVRMRMHNSTGQEIQFSRQPMHRHLLLRLPSGAAPTAESDGAFGNYRSFQPRETVEGWAYFELERAPEALAPLKLALVSGDETPAVIAFAGPEEKVAPRPFEHARSTGEYRGLLWSISGGEIRLDLPGQQANPGQEFIILKVRATNPSPAEVRLRTASQLHHSGKDYLRMEADNGVLLQVSAELNALPWDFPARAEQDALYAWQLPRGSQNPTLVILAPDGSEARLPVGPLPPP